MKDNTIANAYLQTHSARGNGRGGMKWEVYKNTFTNMNARFMIQRSGSGIVLWNQVTGSTYTIDMDSQHMPGSCQFSGSPIGVCSASNPLDGSIESNGWPCLDQPGRGAGAPTAQEWTPVYSYYNGTQSTCMTGGTCDQRTFAKINGACSNLGGYIKETAHSNGQVDFQNSNNIGEGTLANIPSSCTTGQGYLATDQGGNWDTLNATANDGAFYHCASTNNWTHFFTPYTYPHPISSPPSTPNNLQIRQ